MNLTSSDLKYALEMILAHTVVYKDSYYDVSVAYSNES